MEKCVLYLAAVGILFFIVGRLLPGRWFHADRFPFRAGRFEEDGRWVLVDYKTDSPRDVQAVLHKHRPQLNVYADALLRITGMEVKERILYLVRAGAGYVV